MNEPVSVVQTRLVHNLHRAATTLLADAAGDFVVPVAAISGLREFLVPNLHHHHQTEDSQLWPMINAADPVAAVAMAQLSGEHNILDEALRSLDTANPADRATFASAAGVVRDVVHRHLKDEEPVLFPALRDHITEEQWNSFARHVAATAPKVHPHLLVGFIDLIGTDDEIELVLGAFPEPVLASLRDQAGPALATLKGEVPVW
jgi:hypothetical protein